MKQRFSESQIISILKQAESGQPVSELCREHGMSSASFYKWRSKYGGMDASMISELKSMSEENKRLKRMLAESQMQNDILKEALGKKKTRWSKDNRQVGRDRKKPGHPFILRYFWYQSNLLSLQTVFR